MKDHAHILPHFDQALNEAVQQIVALGKEVVRQMDCIYKLVDEKDQKWGNSVIADMEQLSSLSKNAAASCYNLLNLFHPIARDLRLVIALSRCAEKLEFTITELGTLARRGKKLAQQPDGDNAPLLQLFNLARTELFEAVMALENKNKEQAGDVKRSDKELDKFHRELMEDVIKNSHLEERRPLDVDRLFFIRAVERIGDHAKGIAKAVLFL